MGRDMLNLSQQSMHQLQRYLSGGLTLEVLYEWLIGAEYDATLGDGECAALAELRAIAMQVADGDGSRFNLDEAIMELIQAISRVDVRSGTLVDIGSQYKYRWLAYAWDRAESTAVSLEA